MARQADAAYEQEFGESARATRLVVERSRPVYADLDDDGGNELLVFAADHGRCGSGGCNLLVLTQRNGEWLLVATTTVSRLPIYRLNTSTNGWADLGVTIGGGGGPSGVARLRFDGIRYPSNPTVEPLLPDVTGQRVLLSNPPVQDER